MSEEEKKAIEYLKDLIGSYVCLLKDVDEQKNYIKEFPEFEAIRIALNLIDKQQK